MPLQGPSKESPTGWVTGHTVPLYIQPLHPGPPKLWAPWRGISDVQSNWYTHTHAHTCGKTGGQGLLPWRDGGFGEKQRVFSLPEPWLCSIGNCYLRSPEAPRRSVVEIRSRAILKLDTLKNRCADFHLVFTFGSEKARFVLFFLMESLFSFLRRVYLFIW